MPRIPMDDLAFDDRREAIQNGYWPYDVDKWQVLDVLYDMGIEECPTDARDEAREVAGQAIFDKMHPRRQVGESDI